MRLTVKLKLALAFATVIMLSAITAWLGISNLAALNATMEDVLTVHVGRMLVAQNLRPDLLEVVRAEHDLLLAGSTPEQRVSNDAALVKQSEVFGQRIDKLVAMRQRRRQAAARSAGRHAAALARPHRADACARAG